MRIAAQRRPAIGEAVHMPACHVANGHGSIVKPTGGCCCFCGCRPSSCTAARWSLQDVSRFVLSEFGARVDNVQYCSARAGRTHTNQRKERKEQGKMRKERAPGRQRARARALCTCLPVVADESCRRRQRWALRGVVFTTRHHRCHESFYTRKVPQHSSALPQSVLAAP